MKPADKRTSRRRRSEAASPRPHSRTADPYSLLGVAAALSLLEAGEDIARFAAGAISSAAAVPLSAVVLAEYEGSNRLFLAQLDDQPVDEAILKEMSAWIASQSDPQRAVGGGTQEFDAKDCDLRRVSRAGIQKLLVIQLGTVQAVFGAAVAGSGSADAFSPEQRAAVEAIGTQTSLALQHTRTDRERSRLADRLRALNELTRAAVSSLDMAEVFDRVADQVKRLVHFDRLSLTLRPLGADYTETYAVAAEDLQVFEKGARVPLQSPIGDAIRTGQPVVRRKIPDDLVYDNEFALYKQEGYRSTMYIPLESRGRVFGTINFSSFQQVFSDAAVQTAQAVADHLAVIIEHAWLYEESKELAKLQERNRLAHDIHDTLAQSLIGIILELELAQRMIRLNEADAEAEVERARDMAREALDEARRSVLALRPSGLEQGSLDDAFRAEIESLAQNGMDARVSVAGQPTGLTSEIETALYRITQEAVANIRKHAQATKVEASLDYGAEAVTLSINDDGTGFDPAAVRPSDKAGGFGLTSMRERAALLDGQLRVEAAPGRGVRVTAEIPCAGGAVRPGPRPAPSEALPKGAPPIRVLIADDHAVARKGIRSMLEEAADIEVVAEARDGTEALEKARAYRPDVVVTDVVMPHSGGIELVEGLRAEGLEARTLLLTAHLEGDLIVRGMRAGAQGYLLKDAPPEELTEAVRAAYKGETFLQPRVASELARRVGAAEERHRTDSLTPRELEALGHLAKGLRNKEIARDMSLSEATVRFHIAHIFEKLDVGSRTEAVTRALQLDIISQP